jgi:hypothetical protein
VASGGRKWAWPRTLTPRLPTVLWNVLCVRQRVCPPAATGWMKSSHAMHRSVSALVTARRETRRSSLPGRLLRAPFTLIEPIAPPGRSGRRDARVNAVRSYVRRCELTQGVSRVRAHLRCPDPIIACVLPTLALPPFLPPRRQHRHTDRPSLLAVPPHDEHDPLVPLAGPQLVSRARPPAERDSARCQEE